MRVSPRRIGSAAVVLALVLTLVVPAGGFAVTPGMDASSTPGPNAGKVHKAAADDNIPGVSLPASPVNDYAESGYDTFDVFKVALTAGQTFSVSLPTAAGRDFDIYLLSPGAYDVSAMSAYTVASSSKSSSYDDYFTYTATSGGTYYLVVKAYSGYGYYNMSWSKSGGSGPTAASGPTRVKIWGPVSRICAFKGGTLTGALTTAGGAALGSRYVYVQARPYDKTSWTTVAKVPTRYNGNWAATIKPTSKTAYRAVFLRTGALYSSPASNIAYVTPKAALTAPSVPKDNKVGAVFTVTGYLLPKHPAGAHTVVLRCSRFENGTWVRRKTVYTTNQNYNGQTKYSAKMSLPTPGRWKIVAAVAADNKHAATTASPKYAWAGRTDAQLKTDRNWCTYGWAAKLTGKLVNAYGSPISGAYVLLEQSNDGSNWRTVRTLRTNSYGKVTLSVKPESDRYYRLRYKGSSKRAASTSSYQWINSETITYDQWVCSNTSFETSNFFLHSGKHRIKMRLASPTNLWIDYASDTAWFRVGSNMQGEVTKYITLPKSTYYHMDITSYGSTYIQIW